MSLAEFERSHTMADLEEIAAVLSVRRDEKENEERIRRVENAAKQNRGKQ